MDFDTLEGLLDRDTYTGSSSDPASIAEAYIDPVIWPVERLRADQRTVPENTHPDLRNDLDEISPVDMEQLSVFPRVSRLTSSAHSLQIPQLLRHCP